MKWPEDVNGDKKYLQIVGIILLVTAVVVQISVNVLAKSSEFAVVVQGEDEYITCRNLPIKVVDDKYVYVNDTRVKDVTYDYDDDVYIINCQTDEAMDEVEKIIKKGGFSYVTNTGVY